MTKNSPKTYKCHNIQCIFDPKKAKKAKNREFPDKTLPFNDSKQLSPVSDQVLDKSAVQFRIKWPKAYFWSKNGQISDQKGPKYGPDFFVRTKIVIDHF